MCGEEPTEEERIGMPGHPLRLGPGNRRGWRERLQLPAEDNRGEMFDEGGVAPPALSLLAKRCHRLIGRLRRLVRSVTGDRIIRVDEPDNLGNDGDVVAT